MKSTLPAAALCVLVLTGCATTDRYQLSKDDKGRLVRLDTRTGEVMLIEGDKLTPAPKTTATENKIKPRIPPVTLPNGGKAWPPLTVPDLGNANASLTSYWHNGRLHYVVELYPYSKRLKLLYSGYYRNASFSLILNDKTGRRLAWADIPSSRLKLTIGKTREVEQLSAEGIIVMNKQESARLADWQLQWNP